MLSADQSGVFRQPMRECLLEISFLATAQVALAVSSRDSLPVTIVKIHTHKIGHAALSGVGPGSGSCRLFEQQSFLSASR
jgi:hypothetical protein